MSGWDSEDASDEDGEDGKAGADDADGLLDSAPDGRDDECVGYVCGDDAFERGDADDGGYDNTVDD